MNRPLSQVVAAAAVIVVYAAGFLYMVSWRLVACAQRILSPHRPPSLSITPTTIVHQLMPTEHTT